MAVFNLGIKMTSRLLWRSLCWHYLFSRLESSYRHAVVTVRWTVTGIKKTSTFLLRFLCWHYLFSRLESDYRHAVVTVQWTVTGIKKDDPFGSSHVLALPIFPGSHPPSIVGAHELNFCVRDGNRWTLMAINTNYVRWL